MTQRGFREANLKLQSLNERLEERAAELIRANEQLEARNIAVERERATLAAIMASMSDGLIVAGADGQIRYGNERAAELLGLDATALASQSVAEIWARLGFSADDLEAALADAETPPILEASRQEPPARDLLVHPFRLLDVGGAGSGLGAVLRDVTGERELERAKEEVISVVSHELRTPLASIVGFAELLVARSSLEGPEREYPRDHAP